MRNLTRAPRAAATNSAGSRRSAAKRGAPIGAGLGAFAGYQIGKGGKR